MGHGQPLADHLIDRGEAQKALRLSPRSMDKLDRLGVLPKVRIPGLGVVRYRRSDVERLVTAASRQQQQNGRVLTQDDDVTIAIRESTAPLCRGRLA